MKIPAAMMLLSSLRLGAAFVPMTRAGPVSRQLAHVRVPNAAAPRARHLATVSMAAGASVAPSNAVKPLTAPADFLKDIDVFIFDCDGVIWRGDSLIDKVPSVLEKLRQQGKR